MSNRKHQEQVDRWCRVLSMLISALEAQAGRDLAEQLATLERFHAEARRLLQKRAKRNEQSTKTT